MDTEAKELREALTRLCKAMRKLAEDNRKEAAEADIDAKSYRGIRAGMAGAYELATEWIERDILARVKSVPCVPGVDVPMYAYPTATQQIVYSCGHSGTKMMGADQTQVYLAKTASLCPKCAADLGTDWQHEKIDWWMTQPEELSEDYQDIKEVEGTY